MNGWYRRIWRWHFYAGLVSLPFVALLSVTGMIYLFKPSIDDWSERAYDHMPLSGPAHSLDDQVAAAMTALPGARLKTVEWRADPADAARISMLDRKGTPIRVIVRPDTLEILSNQPEKSRPSEFVRTVHGELLAGETGAILVETAGAWGIVLFGTGLYLWWPRTVRGLGGVLYPRRGARFLRDLHAVTGIWISIFALFFLISALPWTKVWGGAFKQVISVASAPSRDWTTGPASEHAQHMHDLSQSSTATPSGFGPIAALVPSFGLAAPVLMTPPGPRQPHWIVSSDSQNRMERTAVEVDPALNREVKRKGFSDKSLIDRIVGIAISAHEGHLFGWINQALGVMTGLGLLTMVTSAALMWWKRRPAGVLGAPALMTPQRFAPLVGMLVILAGVILPMLGASLLAILLIEHLVLRRIAKVRHFLGLA